ncbi:MAG: tetratricopeptide repeat protein [Treponema sp.]|jgi:tetratricopeptide (TPR) repeat protein|nr:tetratricopeptide repeat protein [Treponema sp.]
MTCVFSRGLKAGLFAAAAAVFCAVSCSLKADGETMLRYAKARSLYAEGRLDEALAGLEGAGHFFPALVLRGKAEYFSGDSTKAEKTFRRALRLRPSAAEAGLYLARTLREGQKADEARALLEALVADDPLDIRALRLAASLEDDRGPPGRAAALAFLDRAAEASSECALVFLDRARLRWIAGKGDEALEDLNRARVLLSPGTPLFRAVEKLESAIREASA